jgi:hypothetical protein
MIKRLLIALGVVALCVLAWFVFQKFNPEISMDFTEAELQSKLAEKFPIQKCMTLQLACFDLREPKLTLKEGADRIMVNLGFSARIGSREYPGTAVFSTKVRYSKNDGALFLDDVEIAEFNTGGRLVELESLLKSQGGMLVSRLLQTIPVYTLKDERAKEALAKATIRDVKITNGKLRIVLLESKQ